LLETFYELYGNLLHEERKKRKEKTTSSKIKLQRKLKMKKYFPWDYKLFKKKGKSFTEKHIFGENSKVFLLLQNAFCFSLGP
jgi:predicted nucleotide-binding protein (sugar kinase/HSP70/actin superfamily)